MSVREMKANSLKSFFWSNCLIGFLADGSSVFKNICNTTVGLAVDDTRGGLPCVLLCVGNLSVSWVVSSPQKRSQVASRQTLCSSAWMGGVVMAIFLLNGVGEASPAESQSSTS